MLLLSVLLTAPAFACVDLGYDCFGAYPFPLGPVQPGDVLPVQHGGCSDWVAELEGGGSSTLLEAIDQWDALVTLFVVPLDMAPGIYKLHLTSPDSDREPPVGVEVVAATPRVDAALVDLQLSDFEQMTGTWYTFGCEGGSGWRATPTVTLDGATSGNWLLKVQGTPAAYHPAWFVQVPTGAVELALSALAYESGEPATEGCVDVTLYDPAFREVATLGPACDAAPPPEPVEPMEDAGAEPAGTGGCTTPTTAGAWWMALAALVTRRGRSSAAG